MRMSVIGPGRLRPKIRKEKCIALFSAREEHIAYPLDPAMGKDAAHFRYDRNQKNVADRYPSSFGHLRNKITLNCCIRRFHITRLHVEWKWNDS